MKTYLYGALAVATLASVYGFVAPALVSAESDIAVFLGIALCVATPLALVTIYRIWRRTPEAEATKIKEAKNA